MQVTLTDKCIWKLSHTWSTLNSSTIADLSRICHITRSQLGICNIITYLSARPNKFDDDDVDTSNARRYHASGPTHGYIIRSLQPHPSHSKRHFEDYFTYYHSIKLSQIHIVNEVDSVKSKVGYFMSRREGIDSTNTCSFSQLSLAQRSTRSKCLHLFWPHLTHLYIIDTNLPQVYLKLMMEPLRLAPRSRHLLMNKLRNHQFCIMDTTLLIHTILIIDLEICRRIWCLDTQVRQRKGMSGNINKWA